MDILSVVIIFLLTVIISYPLGIYIGKIFNSEKTFTDFLSKIELRILSFCRINPLKEYTWKQNIAIFCILNSVWLIYAFIILSIQGDITILNPDKISSMETTQALHTAVSFVTNTNLQHYSGESELSYFSQLFVICFLQFVSAASGLAILAVLIKSLKSAGKKETGNIFVYFLKSITRILLPLSVVVGMLLILNSVPMTFTGKSEFIALQGDSSIVTKGPVAAIVAIKQLGTNGGGYFGANSAHPFENPNMLTNIIELIGIALIPIASIFTFGYCLNNRRLSWIIFFVMTIGFFMLFTPILYNESRGNPIIDQLGISNSEGSLEGKEVRFGAEQSAYWGALTTNTSNGSVNAMHDSMSPMSGAMLMLGMQINAFYGGVGVGMTNIFIFIIITVFISGLMIGRIPELFGKKIEAKEIKLAVLVALLHPFLILGGTMIASYIYVFHGGNNELNWLNNPGFHGFSEILYEFTSSAANNGSGFEGLVDNTVFWNLSTALVILAGRLLPIIGTIAIAGSLAQKKQLPQSAGLLKLDSPVFGIMLFFVVIIIGALLFLPALVLGPIAEFTIIK